MKHLLCFVFIDVFSDLVHVMQSNLLKMFFLRVSDVFSSTNI